MTDVLAAPATKPETDGRKSGAGRHLLGWLQAAPLTVVLVGFLVAPIVMIVIVSFWGATEFSIYPAFQFDNYAFLFGSEVTYRVFFATFKYAAITWALTLAIGFTVA
ncbi:MAG: ABC transporter permease, partial [Pseudooceanicola sp.]